VELISSVQEVTSLPPLEEIWQELVKILTEAVHDLDADQLSEESFNSFRAILQIGMEVTRERRTILTSANPAAALQGNGASIQAQSLHGLDQEWLKFGS